MDHHLSSGNDKEARELVSSNGVYVFIDRQPLRRLQCPKRKAITSKVSNWKLQGQHFYREYEGHFISS